MTLPSNARISDLVTQLREARSDYIALAAENIQPQTLSMLGESADALEALAKELSRQSLAGQPRSGEGPAELRLDSIIKRQARDTGLT